MLPAPDPRKVAPPGCYMTDGTRLLEILEADYSGMIGEDIITLEWVEVERVDVARHWSRVRPDGLGGVRERARAAELEALAVTQV